MPILHRPATFLPEYTITSEETIAFAKKHFKYAPEVKKAIKLIVNTGVKKRHLIQPIDMASKHPGFTQRNAIFEAMAKKTVPGVVSKALSNAGLHEKDISAIIFVSCSGFMMPSLTAWLINEMDFSYDTVQLPIAQLGCAAGGTAINQAHGFILAYPGSNVLIISCEFCSLSYQPSDMDVGSMLSDGLFGDAVTAAVVSSHGDSGLELKSNGSYLIPGTADWIKYDVKDTGFHFRLDKRVPGTMEPLAPVIQRLSEKQGWAVSKLDYYIIHAGGPRILDDLCQFLSVQPSKFRYSRDTLSECGNIASSVVFECYRRMCVDNYIEPLDKGIIAGFGPGITAEINLSMGR